MESISYTMLEGNEARIMFIKEILSQLAPGDRFSVSRPSEEETLKFQFHTVVGSNRYSVAKSMSIHAYSHAKPVDITADILTNLLSQLGEEFLCRAVVREQ